MLALCAVHAVEVDVGGDALGAAQAGGVDGDERLAVELEMHVDAVASRARHFADDHPLGLGQRIDEGALAACCGGRRWPPSSPVRRADLRPCREAVRGSLSSSSSRPRFALGADVNQLAAAQAIEFIGLRVQLRTVGLVGHADDRARQIAQAAWRLPGPAAAMPVLRVDDEQEDAGRFDGRTRFAARRAR